MSSFNKWLVICIFFVLLLASFALITIGITLENLVKILEVLSILFFKLFFIYLSDVKNFSPNVNSSLVSFLVI